MNKFILSVLFATVFCGAFIPDARAYNKVALQSTVDISKVEINPVTIEGKYVLGNIGGEPTVFQLSDATNVCHFANLGNAISATVKTITPKKGTQAYVLSMEGGSAVNSVIYVLPENVPATIFESVTCTKGQP